MNSLIGGSAAWFAESLADCETREEWDNAVYRIVLRLFAMIAKPGEEIAGVDEERFELFMQSLKAGFVRQVGRPRSNKQAAGDRKVFVLLHVKTPADGARILQFSERMADGTRMTLPFIDKAVKHKALSRPMTFNAALKRANRSGYQFPEKGSRYGNPRKKG